MPKKKFPKTLYVKHDASEDGESYFLASTDATELADQYGDDVDVGVYELTRTSKIKTKIEVA